MGSRRIKAVFIWAAGAGVAGLLIGFFVFTVIATRGSVGMPAAADGIVVLTGGESRIAAAARLLEVGTARRLLVSGVNRRTSRDDLRRLLKMHSALFDCCVDIGYEALDTAGNADEARLWAAQWHFSRLIVVTASYHMPRSLAEIEIALPEATLVPHAVVPRRLQGAPWWLQATAARTLVAEYFRYLPVMTRLAVWRMSARREPAAIAGVTGLAGERPLAGRL
jgi:uncharacterized SAM-binding protein YcdF (DUF218 family)